jgi:hypothetical protein
MGDTVMTWAVVVARAAIVVLLCVVVVGWAPVAGGASDSDGATTTRAASMADAPDSRVLDPARLVEAASYDEALRRWRSAEDVNAWIGARFRYDAPRALLLSESQRAAGGRPVIHAPGAFFASPAGICVDLSRFAVETLRAIDPGARPAYLMIEFAPVTINGNVLRRHWLVSFERDGKRYFFADSKRPGFLAGPYTSTREFIDEYARYRGREVVTFREMDSYERTKRTLATRQPVTSRPPGEPGR